MSFSWTQGSPPLPDLDFGLCARVSQRFYFPMSPRSFFHPRQRFPIPNHVTSGCMSPRSLFPPGQRFPLPKHITSGCMSPRSLFPTGQRYPIPLPVMTSLDQSEASIWAIWAPFTTRRHHKRTLLYNSRDQESHDRHRYRTT